MKFLLSVIDLPVIFAALSDAKKRVGEVIILKVVSFTLESRDWSELFTLFSTWSAQESCLFLPLSVKDEDED